MRASAGPHVVFAAAVPATPQGTTWGNRELAKERPACSRCGGWLMLLRDHYGSYLSCVRCGNIVDGDHGALFPVRFQEEEYDD